MVGIVALVACSILIAVMVALCAVGRIPRNTIAGLRLPSLFASDTAWKEGHRAAIFPTVTAAIVAAGLGIAVATLPDFAATATFIALAVLLVGLFTGVSLANRAAHVAGTQH